MLRLQVITLKEGEYSREKSMLEKKKDNFKMCLQELQWTPYIDLKNVKGRPSDLTLEKTTQKS